MAKREEIIEEYHCYDSHGELCSDCDECKKALADDLDDFESEIRADERRKFAEWIIGRIHRNSLQRVLSETKNFDIMGIDNILSIYEKEQKNEV